MSKSLRQIYAFQLIVLVAITLIVRGCTLGKYAGHLLGPPEVPARYTLQKSPLVVIVKDLPDPTGLVIESEELTAAIENQFKANALAELIPATKVADYRANHLAEFPTMSPAHIGREVGASQVLFVRIETSQFATEGVQDMVKGKISTSVKVIDAQTGKTLFPSDDSEAGETVTYETPMLRLSDQLRIVNVQRNIDNGVADRIAKLFYKYKPDE